MTSDDSDPDDRRSAGHAPRTPHLTDTDLLRIELGVIWRLDARGRLPGPEDMVIGVPTTGPATTSMPDPGPTAFGPTATSPTTLGPTTTGVPVTDPTAPAADRAQPYGAATTPAPDDVSSYSPDTAVPEHLHTGGLTAAVAGHLPDELAERLLGVVSSGGGRFPEVLATCRAMLGGDRVTLSEGFSYVVEGPVRFDVPAEVVTSASGAHARLVRPLRPAEWAPDEWDELVAGGEGAPWAMIVENGEVVSICHTARNTPGGAEAGTWTSPAHRGRGHAAATTAAWASLLPGVRLYYSTSADNRSSQRVAERLGLRLIGHLWKLTP
ncbi:GNAT family protein [Nonomuraea sp. NPDC049504]|uniref:GNAT family N-acetyltransferase n=1 Tax=Nonomuraea sp. NPDC049504 TaxID=3154729 RepID=UPI00341A791E